MMHHVFHFALPLPLPLPQRGMGYKSSICSAWVANLLARVALSPYGGSATRALASDAKLRFATRRGIVQCNK